MHKKVSEPGLLGFTLLREQFRCDIPFVNEMYERRTGNMGVPSGDPTTPLIKIRFYQQREQDLEHHMYCKEKWKHSKLFNFQWPQKQVNRMNEKKTAYFSLGMHPCQQICNDKKSPCCIQKLFESQGPYKFSAAFFSKSVPQTKTDLMWPWCGRITKFALERKGDSLGLK